MSRSDVIEVELLIIGGGVIGRSIAWECQRRGRQVMVLDRHRLEISDSVSRDPTSSAGASDGHSTSWAAAGILPPANFDRATDPIDRLRGYSHAMWPLWSQQLESDTGMDIGYRHCGGLYLAQSAGERALMAGMVAYWADLDIECRRCTTKEIVERFDFLAEFARDETGRPGASKASDHSLAAWWTPDELQVRPPRVLAALAMAGRDAGAVFQGQCDVTDIQHGSSKVTVEANLHNGMSTTIHAQDVVLCGGASTGLIDPAVGLRQSLIPVRGQILLLHDPRLQFDGVINLGNQYLVGRGDGHVLVGSCEEEVGFEFGNTDSVISDLRTLAGELCPMLRQAREVRRWSGLRPMTFDGFPMIGTVPEQSRLHVASGHYRSGISLAPATAIAMADHLDRRPSFMSLEPFSVAKQRAVANRD
ncbi:MAG: FAD-dependent oxidoreductase [Planctomycetota bacterium]